MTTSPCSRSMPLALPQVSVTRPMATRSRLACADFSFEVLRASSRLSRRTRPRMAIRSFMTRCDLRVAVGRAEGVVQRAVEPIQFGIGLRPRPCWADRPSSFTPVIFRWACSTFLYAPPATAPKMAAPKAQVCGRAADLHRPVADVGVDLHHEGVLLGDAAAIDDLLDRHAVFLEAVDDRQGAEGRGFDQRPIDLRRRWCAASGRPTGRQAADRPGSCDCRCSNRGPTVRSRPAGAFRPRGSGWRADRPWPRIAPGSDT